MGKNYRNTSKTSKTPRRPYEKERIDREMKVIGKYGKSVTLGCHGSLVSSRRLLVRGLAHFLREFSGQRAWLCLGFAAPCWETRATVRLGDPLRA